MMTVPIERPRSGTLSSSEGIEAPDTATTHITASVEQQLSRTGTVGVTRFAVALATWFLLFTTITSFAAERARPYGMPSVDRVLSAVHGKNALDTAARRVGTFDRLISMLAVFEGPRQFDAKRLSPEELRLRMNYVSAENAIIATVRKKLTAKEWSSWIDERDVYSEDTRYVTRTFLSPHMQRVYAQANHLETEAEQAGRNAIEQPAANGEGTRSPPKVGTSALILTLTPLVLLLLYFSRVRLNHGASRLRTGPFRWRVTRVAGTVVDYSARTSVSASGGANGVPVSIRSTLIESIRLKLPDETSMDVRLVNFDLSPTLSDRITLFYARRWIKKNVIFAVINNTTDKVFVSAEELFHMGSGGQFVEILYFILLVPAFLTFIFALFIHVYILALLPFIPLIWWTIYYLVFVKSFVRWGTAPLFKAAAS